MLMSFAISVASRCAATSSSPTTEVHDGGNCQKNQDKDEHFALILALKRRRVHRAKFLRAGFAHLAMLLGAARAHFLPINECQRLGPHQSMADRTRDALRLLLLLVF